jgi:hypothetical protein
MTSSHLQAFVARAIASTAFAFAFASPVAAAGVSVNRVALDDATVQALERAYRTPVRPGDYWYDPVSGVWGFDGGPALGQIHPGLRLGGPLRADASRGRSGVFVNQRELHALDVAALQRCVVVIPGRYWVLANGIGGHEGRAAEFNLAALCGGGQSGGGQSGGGGNCQDYGGGRFSCSNPRTGIGVIGEGTGGGGVFIDGKVISTPN